MEGGTRGLPPSTTGQSREAEQQPITQSRLAANHVGPIGSQSREAAQQPITRGRLAANHVGPIGSQSRSHKVTCSGRKVHIDKIPANSTRTQIIVILTYDLMLISNKHKDLGPFY